MTLKFKPARRIEVVRLVGGRLAIGMAGDTLKPFSMKIKGGR